MFFTITLNLSLTTITAILIGTTWLIYYVVRYTWLNQYERLPPIAQEKSNFTLEGLITDEPDKSIVYPDELLGTFLSSIKLFGYLEQPIFNELSKRLSTIRLVENDYLFHESSSYNPHNFYMVVTGCINVYINCPPGLKSDRPGQLLLHKVTSGGTVSSFFTLLSLLVQSGEKDKVDNNVINSLTSLVAQASQDTTLIVIPSDAFYNLSDKFPKAAAQIALVILTRFQRVTNLTLANYFGCENELHDIAIYLNKITSSLLPPTMLNDGKLELLRRCTDKSITDYPYSEPTTPITPYMGIHFNSARDDLDSPPYASSFQYLKEDVFDEIKKRLDMFSPISSTPNNNDTNSIPNTPLQSSTPTSSAVSQYPPSSAASAVFDNPNNCVEILRFEEDEILVEHGFTMPGIYLILDGIVTASYSSNEDDLDNPIIKTINYKNGSIIGYLESFVGFKSTATLHAETVVYVGFISKSRVERLMDQYPTSVLAISKRILNCLPSIIFQIDFALEWQQAEAGHIIYKQGDESDAIYIILNGRVRTYTKDENNNIHIHREYGAQDRVGEIEVLTNSKRSHNMHAIRDSDIARLPRSLFRSISTINPQIIVKMANNMFSSPTPTTACKLKTVAILPINNVPTDVFSFKLKEAFDFLDLKSVLLTRSKVLSLLGKHAFSKYGTLKLSNWLSSLEEDYDIVLFIGDGNTHSQWNQRCISQADCCLLIAISNDHSSVSDFERYFLAIKTTARKELVLIHNTKFVDSCSTSWWLNNRPWIHAHHHIEMKLADSSKSESDNPLHALKDQLQRVYTRYILNDLSTSPINIGDQYDFRRLARGLSGKSIGIVLGGGGARGISHLGILRALEEAGIPIDGIGGTSIGAFIGGLYAKNGVFLPAYGKAKSFSGRMSSIWRKLFDLTYPITAYFTGHEFNRGLWKEFQNTQIEDFWINYFAVTTNITHSKLEIHQRGYAWRYIRASMSLSGFVPPVSDNGNLLLDGGYCNNLPADIMREMGIDTIIAVDVGAEDDTRAVHYGDSLSGFEVVVNRWNPFARQKIPNLAEIQSRLAYVSSVKQLEMVKKMPNCIYLKPDVQQYRTLDFHKFDEIYEYGYEYGKQIIVEWKIDGTWDRLTGSNKTSKTSKTRRRHSF
eukprot:NODE_111_length_19413_cov_0.323703.p1 type:complete len:1133 gc:universal NODE_111_length_19413_cov_0.323703:19137-15739(-)